jgi:hypothetical protein
VGCHPWLKRRAAGCYAGRYAHAGIAPNNLSHEGSLLAQNTR